MRWQTSFLLDLVFIAMTLYSGNIWALGAIAFLLAAQCAVVKRLAFHQGELINEITEANR